MPVHHLAALLALAAHATLLCAADFHLAPHGSDAGPGTEAAPWQTLARANAHAADPGFMPGDRLLLAGGATFVGGLVFDERSSGNAAQPIVVTSYGSGRARISADGSDGIAITDTGGITITDLDIVGDGAAGAAGINGYLSFTDGRKLPGLTVARCEISGFGDDGITVGSWNDSYPGWQGLVFDRIHAHHNQGAGIFTWDMTGTDDTAYAHSGVVITNCETSHGKNGIIVCGTDGGLVENCYAHHNAGSGGVGIWTYGARGVTIQYCVSSEQTAAKADGSGFDLDGGSQNCVIQYCYSYGNDGCGFMHCDYPDSRPTRDNIIRYCISENDARKLSQDEGALEHVTWGDGLTNCHIVNCVVYLSPKESYKSYGLWAKTLSSTGHTPHLSGCSFRNNIVYLEGATRLWLARNDRADPDTCRFQGNIYWSTTLAARRWSDAGTTYTSLVGWRDGRGQESLDGRPTGLLADPRLVAPGTGGALAGPGGLANLLVVYGLQAGSPARDAGLDVQTHFGIDPGPHDFFAGAIPAGGGFDVGVHEVQPVEGRCLRLRIDPPSAASDLELELDGATFDADGDATWSLELGDPSVDHLFGWRAPGLAG